MGGVVILNGGAAALLGRGNRGLGAERCLINSVWGTSGGGEQEGDGGVSVKTYEVMCHAV